MEEFAKVKDMQKQCLASDYYYFAKDLIDLPLNIFIPLFFSFFYFGMGTDVTMQ